MSSNKETIIKALSAVKDLPTLPTVITRLRNALEDEKMGAEGIARIISEDPTLTSQILRVVNSAYFAVKGGRITSVQYAVSRLGMREINRLCSVLAVIETFKSIGPHLDHNEFWKHSVMTGITARVIYRYIRKPMYLVEDEAYVAGLLHDVGILILDHYFPAFYMRTRQQARQDKKNHDEMERETMDMDHGEVGGLVLNLWNLPPAVVQAVNWHHRPEQAETAHRPLVSIVTLADSICRELEIGDPFEGAVVAYNEKDFAAIGLTADSLPAIKEKVKEEEAQCQSLLTG
ncbi:MAG: HDOD domain-containing protein [bacterium]